MIKVAVETEQCLRQETDMISLREQEAIRARCFHPNGSFEEFGKEEIERSIPHRFERIVRRYPHRIAVKMKHRVLTYAELNATSNRVARAVVDRCGEGPERIVLLFEHDVPMVAAILGVLKAGKIYVPLDPSHPLSRTAYILQDSRAGLMLTNNKNLSLAVDLVEDAIPLMNIDGFNTGLSTDNLPLSPSPDAVAYILYTSGSTGQPKGVVQNHRNVLHDIMQYTNTLHICPEDRMTLLYSYGVNGAVRGILGALLNGATLYPLDIKKEGLANVANFLVHEEISIYHSVPTVFRNLVATLTGKEKFPSLRVIRFGGERVLARDVELYRKHSSDDCLLYTGMGSSETGQVCQYFLNKQTQMTGSVVPIGYPVEDKDLLLLDDSGEEIGSNRVGEIAVRSRYLSLGYWQRPELTRAKFLPGSHGSDKRIHLTGDLGRRSADRCLFHLGRKDSQVKVRGYRIETAEIELALVEDPAVKEAIVVCGEDAYGEPRLVAYCVAAEPTAPPVTDLRRYLRETLPDYMQPSAFVMLDALPLTPNGKVDRRALPIPAPVRPELGTPFVAPQTSIQQTLARIWAEVLGLDRVGIHDNFLDLGGHSLLATRILTRVVEEFTVELPMQSLLEAPTIARMARAIVQYQTQKAGAEELAGILAELEALSDDEAQRLLSDKARGSHD